MGRRMTERAHKEKARAAMQRFGACLRVEDHAM